MQLIWLPKLNCRGTLCTLNCADIFHFHGNCFFRSILVWEVERLRGVIFVVFSYYYKHVSLSRRDEELDKEKRLKNKAMCRNF